MHAFWFDLRSSLRSLRRQPGLAATVVLTLALGIGATTGVFSAVHAVLLSSMPYPEPDQLVHAIATFKGRTSGLSAHDALDYIEQSTAFASLAAHLQYAVSVPLAGAERPENVSATYVSADLFRTLGVAPVLGRTFGPGDARPEPQTGPSVTAPFPDVVIISARLWKSRLGGSPDIVGRPVSLGGQRVTVVGVMPEGFRFLSDVDVWLPMRLNGFAAQQRRFHNWLMVGRLKAGVTLAQAQGELGAIAARLERTYPEDTGMGVQLSGLREALTRQVRPALLLVMAAVSLMLLIACGNVASLLLARAVTRRHELALRVALGASRARLVGQLVTESLTLAVLGGVAGLAVAAALQRVLPTLLGLGGNRLPLTAFHLDAGALAFALGVSLATGAAVGVLPALRSTVLTPSEELKGGSRTLTSGRGSRARLLLVGVQVVLSFVLLLTATLLLRSVARLTGVGLGFDPAHVVTSTLNLPVTVSDAEAAAFFAGVLEEVRALPGVESAGLVHRLPIAQSGGSTQGWTPEHPELRAFSRQVVARVVFPGYFGAMRMPLLAGRDLNDGDAAGSQPVAVVTEATAGMLFDGANPVGRTFLVDEGDPQPVSLLIVGLAADARINRLSEEPRPTMYLPYAQAPRPTMRLVLRPTADRTGVATALRQLVSRRRSDVAIEDLATLDSIIRDSTLAQRSLAAVVAGFALFSLLLAGVGLFGVLAYQVNQRRHEIGIRMALGAQRGHILAAVLRSALLTTGIGAAAGVVVAVAVTRLMTSLLYAVAPTDPGSFLTAAGCLLVVAVAACLVPALRALAVESVQALHYE